MKLKTDTINEEKRTDTKNDAKKNTMSKRESPILLLQYCKLSYLMLHQNIISHCGCTNKIYPPPPPPSFVLE